MRFFWCSAVLVIVSWNQTTAQVAPIARLQTLLQRHSAHTLGDTAYLKGVDSLASLLLDDDSLPRELIPYQQIAFQKNIPGKFRMRYYRYLALQAINKDRFGSAIYYSDKNDEEGVRAGIFEAGGIPHSDLFAISVYGNDRDYGRAFSKYDSVRARILELIGEVPQGKVTPENAFVAFGILNQLSEAAAQAKNTARAEEAVRVSRQLLDAIDRKPDAYKQYRTYYGCVDHMIRFAQARDQGQADAALSLLETALVEVTSPGFLPSMQPYYTFDLYQDAFTFFIKGGQRDSARRYLELTKTLPVGIMEHTHLKSSFVQESASELEALSGDYRAAYTDLRKAYDVQDTALYSVTSDKDNNLYALAEAENTRAELARKEQEEERMQQFNILLFFALLIVVLLVLSGYFIIASRAKQRMLRLRLSLARNFHDEIGPMLLYAGTLVKKETEQHPSPRLEELRGHLVHVMEAVRGITHDLKSNELSTIGSFVKEITVLLEKIRETTAIDFTLKHQNGNRVLSHFQHTHLKKIVSELISNSIRHSGCTSIQVNVQTSDRHLLINYSDNGKGMDPLQDTPGIGLQNVRERVGLLNGTFRLVNEHPAGYAIDLKIPLL
jgi:signal transduction histidine kinase